MRKTNQIQYFAREIFLPSEKFHEKFSQNINRIKTKIMFKLQSMTTNEYVADGFKYKIFYAFHKTPFGKCLIGILNNKEKAICHLSFVDGSEGIALETLKKRWSRNELNENTKETLKYVNKIFSNKIRGFNEHSGEVIHIILKGTEFQIKVWTQLIEIPCGSTTTYEKVAQAIENPKAVRAVANAIANNQIGYLIPCHRVLGKNGSNKYEWGVDRKNEILKYEKE